MNQLKCPSCGSIEFAEDGHHYVCQYCGTMLEKDAGKLAANVSSSSSAEKIIERADMYWNVGKIEKARQLYRQALDIDATNERAQARAR